MKGNVFMLVLKKKKFFLILCFLCISFSSYFLSSKSSQNLTVQNRSYDITQVSALPVTKKVIVIDAGHGGEDRRSCWY